MGAPDESVHSCSSREYSIETFPKPANDIGGSAGGSKPGAQQSSPAEPPKEKITLRFNPLPVSVDYTLRWVLFAIFQLGWIPEWLFWIAQIIVLPLPVLFMTFEHVETIKKRLGVPDKTEITSAYSGKVTFVLWLVVLSGCYMAFTLISGRAETRWVNILATSVGVLGTFIVYGTYVWMLYEFAVRDAVDVPEKPAVAAAVDPIVDAEIDLIDRNDNQIIEMQAELASITQRVDTYTLESALFGALAFSGFLSLVASEKPVLKSIHDLLSVCRDSVGLVVSLGIGDAEALLASKINQDSIIAAVTLETLLCSMLFVSVIISRIRLGDVLKHADYAVRIAAAYNEKEESIHNLVLQNAVAPAVERRLGSIAKRISEAIESARPLFKELWAISGYMRLFRNFGVASFVLILITSAFWASPALGLAFTFVSILAYTYTTMDEFLRNKRLEAIDFFRRHGRLVFRK